MLGDTASRVYNGALQGSSPELAARLGMRLPRDIGAMSLEKLAEVEAHSMLEVRKSARNAKASVDKRHTGCIDGDVRRMGCMVMWRMCYRTAPRRSGLGGRRMPTSASTHRVDAPLARRCRSIAFTALCVRPTPQRLLVEGACGSVPTDSCVAGRLH